MQIVINGFTDFAALWKEDLSDEVAINLIQALGTLRVAYQHIDAANQNMLLAYMESQLEKEITKPKMNEQLSYMLLTWLVKLKPDIVSFSAGASACEKGGKWQQALWLLGRIAESGRRAERTR